MRTDGSPPDRRRFETSPGRAGNRPASTAEVFGALTLTGYSGRPLELPGRKGSWQGFDRLPGVPAGDVISVADDLILKHPLVRAVVHKYQREQPVSSACPITADDLSLRPRLRASEAESAVASPSERPQEPAHGEPADFRIRYHADRLIPSASHGRPTRRLTSWFAPLPLQRVDPGLQTSHRRNLSLQPTEILPHPIPPLTLVHIVISLSLRRGFVPLSRRSRARSTEMSWVGGATVRADARQDRARKHQRALD